MTAITTEWLESVGCKVVKSTRYGSKNGKPFAEDVFFLAKDVRQCTVAYRKNKHHEWLWNHGSVYKPRFRVKATSVKETTP